MAIFYFFSDNLFVIAYISSFVFNDVMNITKYGYKINTESTNTNTYKSVVCQGFLLFVILFFLLST